MTDKKQLMTVESENSITSLMQIAVEKLNSENAEGVVAVIERFVDLELKVSKRNAEKAFFSALAEFQQECPQIAKTSSTKGATSGGSGFGYNYAEIDEIQKTVKPFLYSRGLSFNWDTKMTDNVIECVCTLRHKDGHYITSAFSSPVKGDMGKMNTVQQHGSALTYLKRYTLVSILGLTTTEPDSDGASPESLETITKSQATELEDKADELEMNKPKFLKFFGVNKFADISKADHKRAVGVLEQKEAGK